jgi:two-component system LytT family response regulator
MDKILLIDDDEGIRLTLAGALGGLGYQVATADSGRAGLALAAEVYPDLVVCDLDMPAMHGFEVLDEFRRNDRLADIPFLILTGDDAMDQMRRGMSRGADDYLVKTCSAEELIAAIKLRLERKKSEQRKREEQVSHALELFARAIHDLRDPLFVILGCADHLRAGDGPEPEAASPAHMVDRIQLAAGRMQAIVADILFLTKSRLHRLPFVPCVFDLRDFCHQLAADHEACQRLRFATEGTSCPVRADPLRLRQALENLLANALKYSEGMVTLRLSSNQGYEISVRDEGRGIPAAEQDRLFTPFWRASNTAGKEGHGLGLCIVKSCIDQHQGTIQVESAAGQGATVTIRLPAAPESTSLATRQSGPLPPPAAQAMPHRSVSQPAPGHKRQNKLRALLVEDDPLVRSVMRALLESSGEVEVLAEAERISEARLQANAHKLDVAFLDVNLPGGSGFELLPYLQRGVRVVFVTSADEYAARAFDCEATDYLLKPVTRDRLQQTLLKLRLQLQTRDPSAPTAQAPAGSFLVRTLTERKVVPFSTIRSITSYGEYTWVYWGDEERAMLRKSLRQWEAELSTDRFVRIHRHAIIHLEYLDRVEKQSGGRLHVYLRGVSKAIEVSLRQAAMLNKKLKLFANPAESGCQPPPGN